MINQPMTLNQIQQAGLEALSRELGPVGMVRFLQMFETGDGDYTSQRQKWLDDQDVKTITKRIRQKRLLKEKAK